MKFDGLSLSKNTFFQLKHIQRIYPTLLSPSYVKIHQMTYVIFETICYFSRHSPNTFLAQTLHTFYKNSLSKWKFSDLSLLALKFSKFLMSFFEPIVSVSSKFASLFSVMYFFIKIFIYFGRKVSIKVQIIRLSTVRMKMNQITYVFLQATNRLSVKFCITLQCHDTFFFWSFLTETYALHKKSPSMYDFSDFWVVSWKFTQFLMSFSKP